MTPLTAIVSLAVGYLLGSIPFGIIFTRLAGTQDIRTIGSGNIGATNVLRTGRKGLAAATLLADTLKGTVVVLLMTWWCGGDCGLIAGVGAFVGHLFPIWLKFKGGKGVATFLGVLLAVAWQGVLVFGAFWLAVAAATRYSSLASLVACAAVPVYFWLTGAPREALVFLLLAILTFVMHRANIGRLRQGTEGKIGQKAGARGAQRGGAA
jgi:acyl phosphate:glycerol-3-phosphate acyltransferase